MTQSTTASQFHETRQDEHIGKHWRALFWGATVFNLVIGLLGMLSPQASIDGRIIGLLLFTFGVIFMLVAKEPSRFAPVLWAGVMGKAGIVALLGPSAFAMVDQPAVAATLALDGAFAIGFLAFLLSRSEDDEK